MVTDVYSHILDDDRRKNAELFEEAFYEKKNLDPKMRALLNSLAKTDHTLANKIEAPHAI